MDWRDVMDELPPAIRQSLMVRMAEGDATNGVANASDFTEGLSAVEKALISLLKVDEALQIDAILDKAPEHSPSEILAGLLELEIKGLARQMPGKNYVKALYCEQTNMAKKKAAGRRLEELHVPVEEPAISAEAVETGIRKRRSGSRWICGGVVSQRPKTIGKYLQAPAT